VEADLVCVIETVAWSVSVSVIVAEPVCVNVVTIYPCRGVGSWLTPDLYQAEHQGISLWAGPISMVA
jgi:hypothetical protein